MTKKEFHSIISNFSSNFEYYKKTENGYNENECRLEYIDKLLLFFGWDVYNSNSSTPKSREVFVEKFSEKFQRPDYTLTLYGVSKLFIEAKKPSVDILNNVHTSLQCRKYGWNANHKVSIITNFEYLLVFDSSIFPENTDSSFTGLIKKFHYSEYIEKYDEIAPFLSRESVYNGDFDDLMDKDLESNRHTMKVDDYFLSQMNKWRIAISNDLFRNNKTKYSNLFYLNDVVQRFINKLIFLRICEDRNLDKSNGLLNSISRHDDNKNELINLFKQADKRYNSGLFDEMESIFDINNEVIFNIVKELYYPDSPYLFNIIEPNILGKVYEMFLTETLVVVNDSIALTQKKEFKDHSIVTTPNEIVKFIVSKSIFNLVEGKSVNQLLQLKIADISCGSGIFLEEVFDYLQNYALNLLIAENPKSLEYSDRGEPKLPFKLKKQILLNCIYGIDIDFHAVEVAKFSLLVKLIEDETIVSIKDEVPVLPILDSNIFYGNSLVDHSMLTNIPTNLELLKDVCPFDWSSESGESLMFDAIVGNPPYVSTENMYTLLPKEEVEIYKSNYFSAFKQFDKYYIFLERAILKTKMNGTIGFIVPNKFIKIKSGEKLRRFIKNENSKIEIYDFGEIQLFKDKTIYSSIVFIDKNKKNLLQYNAVKSFNDIYSDKKDKEINIELKYVSSDNWSFFAESSIKTIKNKLVPITDFVEIFNGIQTSAERPVPVYWFSNSEMVEENDSYINFIRNEKEYKIEKSILKPYFKPTLKSQKGLNSYSELSTDKLIIFPYNNQGKLYTIKEMKTHFPYAMQYLEEHYDLLVPKQVDDKGKRDVPNSTSNSWYQYGRTQGLTAFVDTEKLIVGILSKEPMYMYDVNDMLISSGGTAGYCAIKLKETSKYSLEYIQAWLSNHITEGIVREYGSDFEGGFVSRGTSVLKKIMIYPLDLNDEHEKTIYEKIVKYSREIYVINNLLKDEYTRAKRITLIREKDRCIKSISNIIRKIYDLG